MPEAALNITDIELVRLLKASYIAPEQIKELQPLIPEMTAEERQQLMALIDLSHEEAEKAESAYQERLSDLSAKYGVELDNIVKETAEKARKDAEELEEKVEAKELKEVEGEMAEMPSDTHPDKPAPKPMKQPVRNRHVAGKLIVILLFLLAVAGIVLYSMLTT